MYNVAVSTKEYSSSCLSTTCGCKDRKLGREEGFSSSLTLARRHTAMCVSEDKIFAPVKPVIVIYKQNEQQLSQLLSTDIGEILQ